MTDKNNITHPTARKPLLIHVTTVPESLWAFMWGQIGFMKKNGFEIHAVSSPGEMLDKFADREKVPVHGVRMPRRITPFTDCISLFCLWMLLKNIRPDIVHSHTPKGGLLGMIGAWLARVPVRVYQIHGLPLTTATGIKRSILWLAEKVSCRLAHQVLCISHSVAREAVELGLCPADKIHVLGHGSNGVDAQNKFNPVELDPETRQHTRKTCHIPEDALVLGFVGRIVRDKGMSELAKAWSFLRNEFPKLHLLLVGPIEPQDPISADTSKLFRNDPRIHIAGEVRNMPPYYMGMDICVLPTYREGFPNVLLEAGAMELPVVATRVPGCIDAVVDGETGILIPPRNANALTDALRGYILSPHLRMQHGKSSRIRVLQDFQPKLIWHELHQEYISLLLKNGLLIPCPEQSQKTFSFDENRAA
jgi:glycosyltransferase involved in cell wall biosynthesis